MQERLGDSIWVEGTEITKEDFNFPATVKSNGSLEVSDMNLATQKAWMRLQAAMQMQQFNVADLEDLYNSYRDWLEKDGVKDPEMYSTNPQAVLQGKLMQMQQQLQQMASQIQQNGKLLDAGQKEIAKVKKTFKEETNNFEGEMEAISNGAYSKSESGTS
jgi:predicted  nucleic acid-binding Zn-ribbon protein